MKSKFTQHFLLFFLINSLPVLLSAQIAQSDPCDAPEIKAQIIPSCRSQSNGSLKLEVTNGLPPYQIQWESGDRLDHLKRLAPGEYRVRVTDALGCATQGVFSISEFRELQAEVNIVHNKRAGQKNGTITINMSGGQPPYRFSWISSTIKIPVGYTEGLNSMRRLPPGFYKIVVFDEAGCYYEIQREVK